MSAATDQSSKPRRTPWPWLTALVALIGIGGAAAVILSAGSPGETPGPAAPLAEFVSVQPAGDTVILASEGFVSAPEEIDLVSEVEGRVVSIADDFRSGARFAAGATLFKIDPALYAAALQQAEADLASARSALDEANNQLDRLSALAAEDFSSEARQDQVRVDRDAAAARVEQAEAAVERARIRLGDTTIRAPFDAWIVEESVAPGRYVRPGEPLARVAATGAAEIEIGLSPAQAALLTTRVSDPAGLPARVAARGIDMRGRIDRVKPRIDPAARTLDLVVRVDGAFSADRGQGTLRLDELAAVAVEVPAEEGWWRLPARALKSAGRVWRIADDDTLQPVDVKLVLRGGDYTTVSGPLAAGDRVLLTDLTSPAPGFEVRPLESADDGGAGSGEGREEAGR